MLDQLLPSAARRRSVFRPPGFAVPIVGGLRAGNPLIIYLISRCRPTEIRGRRQGTTVSGSNGETISAAYIWGLRTGGGLRTGAKDNPTMRHLQALARFFQVSPPTSSRRSSPSSPRRRCDRWRHLAGRPCAVWPSRCWAGPFAACQGDGVMGVGGVEGEDGADFVWQKRVCGITE